MINGISAAMGAVSNALDQFDRAMLTTVTAVENPDGVSVAGGKVEMPDGLVGMDTARLAVQAALVAASTSVSMLDEVIKLGDYNHKNDSESQPSQSSSASQQDSSQTVQLLTFAQLIRSPESTQQDSAPENAAPENSVPENAAPAPEAPAPQASSQPK